MVPVVATSIGLVTSAPTCNRMPPDGHEFPQKYTETSLSEQQTTRPDTVFKNNESEPLEIDLPPLPASEPPLALPKNVLPFDTRSETLPEKKLSFSDSRAIGRPTRNSLWRKDEKSEKSVRDKIAMFSSVPDSTEPCSSSSDKINKYKSSEDVCSYDDTDCNKNFHGGRLFSRSVMMLDRVPPGTGSYFKKPSFGETPASPRSLDFSNRTQSSMDLSSSAYSSSCSPDSSLSSNSSYLGYSSTLPRKKNRSDDGKNETAKKNVGIQRATSFSIHRRSQSLLDVSPNLYKPHCLLESSQDDSHKPGSLSFLIEQRKKNLSKLKGLVIPEKVADSIQSQPIVDLPEIRSKDLILNSKVPSSFKENSVPPKWNRQSDINSVKSPTPLHLWDLQNKTPTVPKYSPAFKRKSISVFGAKELLNLKKETGTGFVTKPQMAPIKPPRNILSRQNSMSENLKILPVSEITYSSEKVQKANDVTHPYKGKTMTVGKYHRAHTDFGKSEEDSDDDSAVSSSRSSVSHGFSPPMSPLLESQFQGDNYSVNKTSLRLSSEKIPLARTLSSETTASTISTTSTLTYESRSSTSSSEGSNGDSNNKRILKPQSVEAINRKNVLASAKYSRGFDAKSGSPLIQRKFSGEAEPLLDKNSNLAYSISQSLLAGRKPVSNEVYSKAELLRPKIEKIAYINDVVDEINLSEDSSKKKLEKSESLPSAGTDLAETNGTKIFRRTSVPFGYSWDSDYSWNDSDKTANDAFDKSEVTGDKNINLSSPDLKSKTDAESSGPANQSILNAVKKPKVGEKGALPTLERQNHDRIPNENRSSQNLNDIRKSLEKVEPFASTSVKGSKTGNSVTFAPAHAGFNGNHIRMSSLDSNTSEDGPCGFSNSLQREQFGSITSLASSTSLISTQVRTVASLLKFSVLLE